MRRVFVDTSGWFDIVIPGTRSRGQLIQAMEAPETKLVTSTYVLDELISLLLSRRGYDVARAAASAIRSSRGIRMEHPDAAEEARAWHLFLDGPDKSYTLTDCLSFVIMRRLGITEAITLDHHFRQEGFMVLP